MFHGKVEICISILIFYQLVMLPHNATSLMLRIDVKKKMDNNNQKQLISYDHIIRTLSALELKLLDNRLSNQDLILILKLKSTMDKQKTKMKAPEVYWYSRQGR